MPEESRPPDYVMQLMAKAAKANLADPFLRGRLIELPPGGDVLIAGDLHGHIHNFRRIVKIADLPRHPNRHVILQELLHSMYDDTPDRSYQLLEEAAIYKTVYPRQVHIILANHDIAELHRLDIMKKGRSVLRAFDTALEEAYQFNKDVVHKAYCRFLRSLPWAAATPNGVFICHSIPDGKHLDLFSRDLFTKAGPDEDVGKGTPAFHLTWGRDVSRATASEFARRVGARIVVTGHHPCRQGHSEPTPWHIILDSKDAYGAYLLMPLGGNPTQADLVRRIRFLNF